jgi:DNA repair protein SbcC/Rad50
LIPLSLTLRNFLSYGAESQTLDFRGQHVLCLSGDNGHGKSALLDAMTWALFGRARANTDDELLHHGANEMHVVLDIALNGLAYRISRLRTSKGKTRLTHLDLQIAEPDGGWRSLNGNSVRETERAIEQLLGMNYQTFINSAFLLQGRADEFTVKPPAERKKVLADVLNLDAYERLSLRAKERRQQWHLTATGIQAELADLDRQLLGLPEARATLEESRQRRAVVDAALPPAEALLQQLRAAHQQMERHRQEQEQLQQRRNDVQLQLRDHRQRIAVQETRLENALQVLAERESVERDYACWREQRALAQEQANRLLALQPLQREQQALQRCIDGEEHALGQQAAELRGKLGSCVQETARGLEANNLLDALLAELALLEQTPEQRMHLQQRQTELREAVAGRKAQNESAEVVLQQLRTRYQTLGNGDTPCPICAQPLSPAQRQDLRATMKAEADQRKAAQQENLVVIARHEAALKQLAKEAGELERQGKRLDQAKLHEATLREKIRAAECARDQARQWELALREVMTRLDGGTFATEARQKLAAVTERIGGVAYDATLHREAERAANALAPVEAKRRQLEEAQQTRSAAEESLDHLRASLKSWEQQEADLLARLATLSQELTGSAAIEEQFRRQVEVVEELQAERLAAAGAVAAAEQAVASLLESEQRRGERLIAIKEAQEQQALYAELETSFGRNGVQAMLIDEAIPLIQEEANKLLNAMTDGRLSVSLETQRLTQKQATVETLDVRISDELGTRNYELYSGGEAFRVNFALRIALSRLLAHRAGARLQTLVIDEGFGSQDATGRDRIQSALKSVEADFACIIVITHLDEMKEWFSNRVEVVKDSSGSHLRVVTV